MSSALMLRVGLLAAYVVVAFGSRDEHQVVSEVHHVDHSHGKTHGRVSHSNVTQDWSTILTRLEGSLAQVVTGEAAETSQELQNSSSASKDKWIDLDEYKKIVHSGGNQNFGTNSSPFRNLSTLGTNSSPFRNLSTLGADTSPGSLGADSIPSQDLDNLGADSSPDPLGDSWHSDHHRLLSELDSLSGTNSSHQQQVNLSSAPGTEDFKVLEDRLLCLNRWMKHFGLLKKEAAEMQLGLDNIAKAHAVISTLESTGWSSIFAGDQDPKEMFDLLSQAKAGENSSIKGMLTKRAVDGLIYRNRVKATLGASRELLQNIHHASSEYMTRVTTLMSASQQEVINRNCGQAEIRAHDLVAGLIPEQVPNFQPGDMSAPFRPDFAFPAPSKSARPSKPGSSFVGTSSTKVASSHTSSHGLKASKFRVQVSEHRQKVPVFTVRATPLSHQGQMWAGEWVSMPASSSPHVSVGSMKNPVPMPLTQAITSVKANAASLASAGSRGSVGSGKTMVTASSSQASSSSSMNNNAASVASAASSRGGGSMKTVVAMSMSRALPSVNAGNAVLLSAASKQRANSLNHMPDQIHPPSTSRGSAKTLAASSVVLSSSSKKSPNDSLPREAAASSPIQGKVQKLAAVSAGSAKTVAASSTRLAPKRNPTVSSTVHDLSGIINFSQVSGHNSGNVGNRVASAMTHGSVGSVPTPVATSIALASNKIPDARSPLHGSSGAINTNAGSAVSTASKVHANLSNHKPLGKEHSAKILVASATAQGSVGSMPTPVVASGKKPDESSMVRGFINANAASGVPATSRVDAALANHALSPGASDTEAASAAPMDSSVPHFRPLGTPGLLLQIATPQTAPLAQPTLLSGVVPVISTAAGAFQLEKANSTLGNGSAISEGSAAAHSDVTDADVDPHGDQGLIKPPGNNTVADYDNYFQSMDMAMD